jgi:hypothetical protein
LFAAFISLGAKASGPAQGAPDAAGMSMTASLIRLTNTSADTPAPASEMTALDSLRQQLQTDVPSPTTDPKPAVGPATAQAILDAFDHAQPAEKTPHSSATAAHSGQNGASGTPIDDPLARASLLPLPAKAPAPTDLWRQVARCWRPTASEPVEVRVSVSLDSRGQLTRPPQLIDGRAISKSRDRLTSEADAIQAVIACAPYAEAPQSAELDFKPGGSG